MICSECMEANQKSTIRFASEVITSHPMDYYYDEHGRLHNHDPNITETTYTCSNGHTWTRQDREFCEACGK